MTDRPEQIAAAAEQLLRDGDVLVNELAPVSGALPNQTVSDHVALAAMAGKPWACWFCAFLSWAVQKDHCAHTLDDSPVPWTVYPRAAFWFVLILGSPFWIWLAVR